MNAKYNAQCLLDAWRQSGSTTHNASAALNCEGLLIVGNLQQANIIQKNYPGLQVRALSELPNYLPGKPKRPIFFDTTAILALLQYEQTNMEQTNKPQNERCNVSILSENGQLTITGFDMSIISPSSLSNVVINGKISINFNGDK